MQLRVGARRMVEPPAPDAPAEEHLVALDLDPRCGEDSAVVGSAGPWAVLVDGAALVAEHRATAVPVVAEDDVAVRHPWRGNEQLAGDVGERVRLVGSDMHELTGRTAGRATAAGDVGDTFATEGGGELAEPRGEVAGRELVVVI